MEIKTKILELNDCYRAGWRITPKGIMVHSTGANNPNLARYVGPNMYNNDWNRPGLDVCVHAFIGKDTDGEVNIVQTLPWDWRGWHAGGAANNTHISFEMCEDNLQDWDYMMKVRQAAIELCAYLCITYNLNPMTDIISHKEGYALGIASNHGDPDNWWGKYFSRPMDNFREAVADELASVRVEVSSDETERPMTEDEKWAVDAGLFVGYGNGKYGFDDPLTRGQLCTVLRRAEKMWFGDMSDGKPTELLNDILNQYQEKEEKK